MKLSSLFLCTGSVLVAAVVAVGCGDDTANPGGAGGTGVTTATGSSTSKTATGSTTHATTTGVTSTGTSTGSGAPHCELGLTADPAVGICANPDPGGGQFVLPNCAGVPTTPPSNGACYTTPAPTGAGGAGGGEPLTNCNPITGAECTGAGEACDNNGDVYGCYPPPNDATLCGACDNSNFCANGLTCVPTSDAGDGACVKYCCTDADCGG